MTITGVPRLPRKPVDIGGYQYYRMTKKDIYECLGWERESRSVGESTLNIEYGDRAYILYTDGTTWFSDYNPEKPRRTDIDSAIWVINDWSYGLFGNAVVVEYFDPKMDDRFVEAIFEEDLDYYEYEYEDVKVMYSVYKSKSEPIDDIEHMIKSRRK